MVLRSYGEGLFGWSRFQPDRGYDFSGTALVADGPDAGTVLLVDPVPATEQEQRELESLGSHFVIVALNAHHERDAAAFARRFDAPIFVPRPDAEQFTSPGARAFDDGHAFPGGWIAHVLPGMKTPGESVLHHRARRVLVVGDAVIADPLTGLRLPPPHMLPDRTKALDTLRTLLELDFDALLAADGFVLPSGGRDALRRFLEKTQG